MLCFGNIKGMLITVHKEGHMRTISVIVILAMVLPMYVWSNYTCQTCPICSLKSRQSTKTCCDKPAQEKSCCGDSKSPEKKSDRGMGCACCSFTVAPLQGKKAIVTLNRITTFFIGYPTVSQRPIYWLHRSLVVFPINTFIGNTYAGPNLRSIPLLI